MPDKYTAVWVSHTSISDFLNCPRAYFLKNIYRDPQTGHKVKLMSPPLALGQAVHEVVEALSVLPVEERFKTSLVVKLDESWKKISGKQGGFVDKEQEAKYKERGVDMLNRLIKNPGPLEKLAVKIKMDLPHYWLSEKDNIILCGKIDWLQYLPQEKKVHIIDFKTGRQDEDPQSLQLSIYYLLAANCQQFPVSGASYWYLDRSDKPVEQSLPQLEEAKESVLVLAKKIKLARQLSRFKCPRDNGCQACRPYEAIINGNAEFVGLDSFHNDVYIIEHIIDQEKKGVVL